MKNPEALNLQDPQEPVQACSGKTLTLPLLQLILISKAVFNTVEENIQLQVGIMFSSKKNYTVFSCGIFNCF
jgi:hypothetical protein